MKKFANITKTLCHRAAILYFAFFRSFLLVLLFVLLFLWHQLCLTDVMTLLRCVHNFANEEKPKVEVVKVTHFSVRRPQKCIYNIASFHGSAFTKTCQTFFVSGQPAPVPTFNTLWMHWGMHIAHVFCYPQLSYLQRIFSPIFFFLLLTFSCAKHKFTGVFCNLH